MTRLGESLRGAWAGTARFLEGIVQILFAFAWLAAGLAVFPGLPVALIARRWRRNAPWRKPISAYNRENLERYGKGVESREETIHRLFDERKLAVFYEAARTYSESIRTRQQFGLRRISFELMRNLGSMEAREREGLRATELLFNRGLIDDEIYDFLRFGFVYGDGKCLIDGYSYRNLRMDDPVSDGPSLVKWHAGQNSATTDSAVSMLLSILDQLSQQADPHPIVEEIRGRISGGISWLSPRELESSVFTSKPEGGLFLGYLDRTERPVYYTGEGSIITIAPPGSGKTQCSVIPNLLAWPGPAVVLDVKGEIFETTSAWRAKNVGPIYKFSPLDPAGSHCFNPLSFVRNDPSYVWEDARFLADMMIVPNPNAKDPFWENKARDLLTAAIARVCYGSSSEKRPLSKIIDIMHQIDWDDFIETLKESTDVPPMRRAASDWAAPKTLEGILQTAQMSLSAWESERISRVTARSDWSPLDLRSGSNPTIYICLKPNEIESYTSLLRTFISQHIRMLTSELPSREDSRPILFMLDELPRLRQMPPVEEALEVGRQYGLRLWMFTQSLGQLDNAYPNAKGMVGSCAVRCFMNPSLHDGTAEKLSEELGYRESVLDGSRQKNVEAPDLAGPAYKDFQVVMATGCKPMKVRKHFAYTDANLRERMGRMS